MLKGGESKPNSDMAHELSKPILGLANMIHEMVNKMPGMMSGTIDNAKNKRRSGVLVRSFIQANAVPMTNANKDVPNANCTEFQKIATVSGLLYAVT
jgi:hypothetical protein